MEVIKRPGSPTSSALQLSKRSRPDAGTLIVREGPKRTSSLQAPIMLLTGHQGSVLSFKFDPSGQNCASSSVDKTVPLRAPGGGWLQWRHVLVQVLLWRVAGANDNYCVLRGHKQVCS
jgi:Prp8 binding protein